MHVMKILGLGRSFKKYFSTKLKIVQLGPTMVMNFWFRSIEQIFLLNRPKIVHGT